MWNMNSNTKYLDFNPKRVLIIKLRHHGDVLLVSPLARALKSRDASCQVDVLIYQETLDMLRHNDDFRKIYTIDRQWKKQGVWKHAALEIGLLKDLKANQYDLIIHLTDSWRGAIVSKLCQPKVSLSHAYEKRENWLWKACFTELMPMPDMNTHMVVFNLNAFQTLGFAQNDVSIQNYPLKLNITAQDTVSVRQQLAAQGWQGGAYILVHPGARWFFKCWDDDKMLDLIQRLLDAGHNVVLSGGKDDKELEMVSYFRQHLKNSEHLYDLVGKLNLAQLAALIADAKLFIGVDSAPMHMAAALGVSGVALFGPSKLGEWSPWSEKIEVIYAGDYGDLIDPDQVDTSTDTRYLSNISVDTVWGAVNKKLS